MNEFYLSRKISARLSLRAAVRMFCILTLALWGPVLNGILLRFVLPIYGILTIAD